MSKLVKMWKGTGYNKNVRLKQYVYSDNSIHYEFRDRLGMPGNPTASEAKRIIESWRLIEVQ